MTPLQLAAVKALRNKKIRRLIISLVIGLVLLPVLLLFMIVTAITSSLHILMPPENALQADVYYQSIQSVRFSYGISNDFPTPIVKMIHFNMTGDLSDDKGEIQSFVKAYFVDSEEVEVPYTGELMDGREPEYETVYFFKDLTALLGELTGPSFGFAQEDVEFIQVLYFASVGGGNGGDIPQLQGKYPMPVNGTISSGFGNRIDPLNGEYFLHPALDIVPVWHSPVSAIADGVVVKVNISSIYGNNVTIAHNHDGERFTTFSAHLSRVDVAEGQAVQQGDIIGLEGGDQENDPNPGRTTGHHLHFEVWLGHSRETAVDPGLYLKSMGEHS